MYDVFNNFLNVETWYKDHPNDNERFYHALSKVIDNEDFSPDAMAEHMHTYKNVTPDDDTEFSRRIEELQSAAWHIRDYRKTVG